MGVRLSCLKDGSPPTVITEILGVFKDTHSGVLIERVVSWATVQAAELLAPV